MVFVAAIFVQQVSVFEDFCFWTICRTFLFTWKVRRCEFSYYHSRTFNGAIMLSKVCKFYKLIQFYVCFSKISMSKHVVQNVLLISKFLKVSAPSLHWLAQSSNGNYRNDFYFSILKQYSCQKNCFKNVFCLLWSCATKLNQM